MKNVEKRTKQNVVLWDWIGGISMNPGVFNIFVSIFIKDMDIVIDTEI